MRYFIGIDNGGTSTKAAVFSEKGVELGCASRDTPLNVPRPGFQERDMDELWRATAYVIRKALEMSGIHPGDIAGVGCTGHGKGIYLTGRDGRPLRPAIASTDRRGLGIVNRWDGDGTARKAAEKTCQPVSESQAAVLLRWLKENERESYDRIGHIFEAKDYIRFCLTGKAMAEYTDYSGTSLMDIRTREFDRGLTELFGIGEIFEALPELCRADENCGAVTEKAAAETGIPAGTPVCGGMFDIDACAIAMAVTDEGPLCAISGTWSINEYLSKTTAGYDGTTRNSLYCLPDMYLIEESSPTSAGNLEWIRENICGESLRSYNAINKAVESVKPEDCNALFLPFLYGTNTGCRDGAFLGLTNMDNRAVLLRAVFEGVAFSHRTHIERLLKLRERPEEIRLSGGVVSSPVWVKIFADCMQISIKTVPVKNAGALGCCIAAAVAAGVYPDMKTAAESMTPEFETVLPDASKKELYDRKFERYLRAAEALEVL